MKSKDILPNRTVWTNPARRPTPRTLRLLGAWKIAVVATLFAVLLVLAGTFFWVRMHGTFDPANNSTTLGQDR